MRKLSLPGAGWAAVSLLTAGLLLAGRGVPAAPDYGRAMPGGAFGTLHVYEPAAAAGSIVLFASGDGGWNLGVLDMARQLTRHGAVVIGFSTPHYLEALAHAGGSCLYPAGDLETLSRSVQKRLRLPRYHAPVLVGYSSGATLVYAALAAAPGGTFKGGISLGFSADLAVRRPLCRGSGLTAVPSTDGKAFDVEPRPLAVPWIALQGEIDKDVDPRATDEFVRRTANAKVIDLPHVGHGFSVERNWIKQYLAAFDSIVAPRAGAASLLHAAGPLADLPLIELPSSGAFPDYFAVVLSGDGGWVNIDKSIGGDLAARGMPVVGLNSLQYFWTARQPAAMSADLARIITHYGALWNRRNVVLIGYSLGADVLPFMVDGLPEPLRRQVRLVTLLGPGRSASFEFHIGDWFGASSHRGDRPIEPAVAQLADTNVLCVYGADETGSLCPLVLGRAGVAVLRMGRGHHFGGDYRAITLRILAHLPAERRAAPAPRA
jgi:type IV secretory pathway VirJ component